MHFPYILRINRPEIKRRRTTVMNQAIEEFTRSKAIAVVGVSTSGRKFGNSAYKELAARGYQVYAVHPTAKEIDGVRCYPNLTALKGVVDGVLVSVPPARALGVVREAGALGLRNVWLQKGAESAEVLDAAGQLALNVVSRKCVLMYAPPVRSVHAFHRAIMRLFGRL
jgi:predicted CoA-binding protein